MAIIESLLEEIDQLPPVSDTAGKVLTLLDDPDAGMSDLADIIRYEPSLTANVLKLANSAYFGLPGKIEDARQAIIYLGMTQVVELVLLVCCSESFGGTYEGYELEPGELWSSAVSAAIMAGDLSEAKGLKQGGLIFTGALLRDIGKVVMNSHLESVKEQILNRVEIQGITFMVAERQVLGFDHTQVGAMIAKKWNFPPSLACIIRYYHTPLEAKGCFKEASIVHLADAMCRKLAIGVGVDDPSYVEDERMGRSLGSTEAEIKQVIDGFGHKLERVNTLFEID